MHANCGHSYGVCLWNEILDEERRELRIARTLCFMRLQLLLSQVFVVGDDKFIIYTSMFQVSKK